MSFSESEFRKGRKTKFLFDHETKTKSTVINTDEITVESSDETSEDTSRESLKDIINHAAKLYSSGTENNDNFYVAFQQKPKRRTRRFLSTGNFHEKNIRQQVQTANENIMKFDAYYRSNDSEESLPCDPEIFDGCKLPLKFPRCPKNLVGKPLEEIDRLIDEETFVVINNRFGQQYLYRFNTMKSFFIFSPTNPIRKIAIKISTNQLFEISIILLILVYSIISVNPKSKILLDKIELVLNPLFLLELVIRCIARGAILNSYSHFRNVMNWLDLVVIFISFASDYSYLVVTVTDKAEGIAALRGFRVFRVLKTMQFLPGVRAIGSTLVSSFSMLLDVIYLFIILILTYANIFTQFWGGTLKNKCVKNVNWSSLVEFQMDTHSYYVEWISAEENWQVKDNQFVICGNKSGAGNCENGFTCLENIGNNSGDGYTNFDNFFHSSFSVFQLITLDNWESLYHKVIRANGSWHVLFFVLIVFFGSYYLINLMLAVVTLNYNREQMIDSEEKKKRTIRQKMKLNKQHPLPSKLSSGKVKSINKKTSNQNNMNKLFASLSDNIDDELVLFKQEYKGFDIYNAYIMKDGSIKIMLMNRKELIDRNYKTKLRGKPIYGKILYVQNQVYNFITQKWVDRFLFGTLIINIVIALCDYYPIDNTYLEIDKYSEYVFATIFFVECNLKLFGMAKVFFKNGWNTFDLIISYLSFIQMFLPFNVPIMGKKLRLLKITYTWDIFYKIMTVIFHTLSSMAYLSIIIMIAVYLFAALGYQMLRSHYQVSDFGSADEVPRWNFNDFWHSMLLVFRIFCGEWIEPMRECLQYNTQQYKCFILFIPAFIIGNMIFLSLFLALLLDSISNSASTKKSNHSTRLKLSEKIKQYLCQLIRSNRKIKRKETSFQMRKMSSYSFKDDKPRSIVLFPIKPKGLSGENSRSSTKDEVKDSQNSAIGFSGWTSDTQSSMSSASGENSQSNACCWTCPCCPTCERWTNSKYYTKWEFLRKKARIFVKLPQFEYLILIFILASCVTLTYEDIYLEYNVKLFEVIKSINNLFMVLFTIEFIIRCMAMGLKQYFTTIWTILDFMILAVTIVDSLIIPESMIPSGVVAIRIARAFRPLRSVSRMKGLKVLVNSLIFAIPRIAYVVIIAFAYWLIFSIYGVHLFKGQFYKCVEIESNKKLNRELASNKSECESNPEKYKWINSNIHFNNVAAGLLALFQTATFEGWMEVINDAVDSVGINEQPILEYNFYAYIYFVIFIAVGSLLFLNLFIGVVIDNFSRLRQQYQGGYLFSFLSEQQRNYFRTLKNITKYKLKKQCPRPNNLFLGYFYDITSSLKYEIARIFIIMIYLLIVAFKSFNMRQWTYFFWHYFNFVYSIIFVTEITIKIMTMPFDYFTVLWNCLDFMLVLLNAGFIHTKYHQLHTLCQVRIVQFIRLGQVLRVYKLAKNLRKLLHALLNSLPELFYVGCLLFLILFIYAVIGMHLFGKLKVTGVLDDVANFATFESSIVLLIRLSTSGGWNEVMDAMMLDPNSGLCNKTHYFVNNQPHASNDGECGVFVRSILFMVSLVFISYFVVTNIYIAIILENYMIAHEYEELGVSDDDITCFYIHWRFYDPDATEFILIDQLTYLVSDLDEPLGVPMPNDRQIFSLSLPVIDGEKVHCFDLLKSLVLRAVGGVEKNDAFHEMNAQMEFHFRKVFPNRCFMNITHTFKRYKMEQIACQTLQRAWKQFKAFRLLEKINSNSQTKTFLPAKIDLSIRFSEFF